MCKKYFKIFDGARIISLFPLLLEVRRIVQRFLQAKKKKA